MKLLSQKKEPDANLLYLPGSEQRELWKPVAPGSWSRMESDDDADSSKAIFCLGADDVFALPMWVQSNDPEVIRGIIRIQFENQGISTEAGLGCHVDFFQVHREGDRFQILAVVLADSTDLDTESTMEKFSGYQITPFLYDFPENTAVLWQEKNRWVVAFTRGKKVAYFQQLTTENSGLLTEVRGINEMLLLGGFIARIQSVEIRHSDGTRSQQVFDASGKLHHMPEQILQPDAPVLKESERLSGIVPRNVAERKAQRKRLHRIWMWGAVAVVLYNLAMGSWAGSIFRSESKNRVTQKWLASNDSEVSEIREAQGRWNTLGATIEVDRFPLEIFHHIVSLLPDEGVRLTHFEMEGSTVTLRGEASSTGEAIAWKGKVKASEALSFYEWNFPSPEILQDNRARFVARGARTDIIELKEEKNEDQ